MANGHMLLIGWDAADWGMIDRLTREGKMPILAGMAERSVTGNLAALYLGLSPTHAVDQHRHRQATLQARHLKLPRTRPRHRHQPAGRQPLPQDKRNLEHPPDKGGADAYRRLLGEPPGPLPCSSPTATASPPPPTAAERLREFLGAGLDAAAGTVDRSLYRERGGSSGSPG